MSFCSSFISNWSVPLLHSWVRLSAGSTDTTVHQQLHGWGWRLETSDSSIHSSFSDAPDASNVQVCLESDLIFLTKEYHMMTSTALYFIYFPFVLPTYCDLCFLRSSVNLQDPFSEGNDPGFPRKNMTPNSAYQSSINAPDMQGRMGPYEPNKDPFSNIRKGWHYWFPAPLTSLVFKELWMGHNFKMYLQLGSSSYLLAKGLTVGWVTSHSSNHHNSSPHLTEDHLEEWAPCQWDPGSSILMDPAMTGGTSCCIEEQRYGAHC